MDKKNISPNELEIGMFVELPASWLSHSFLQNNFKISNKKQLNELKKLKFKDITVDFSQSDVKNPHKAKTEPLKVEIKTPAVLDPKFGEVPKQWSSDTLMTDDLKNVLEDTSLPPKEKSIMVYQNTVSLMEQLLEFPSVNNIKTSISAIYSLSNMILSEDDTANNMLQITSHDFYTYTHSVNVGLTGILFAKELFKNSDAHDLNELAAGFFLHDLGKVKISPEVLNKPARLTDIEMQHVKTHPYQGYKLLKEAGALSNECKTIVMQHHEYIDGSGYPKRLKDNDIELYGKICAIVDVYDALTAERSYKKAMTPIAALHLMKAKMLDKFDKKLFARFVKIF